MHTITINQTTFNHNGDYSGDVVISRNGDQLWVPFDDLKGFVADYVRRVQQAKAENAIGKLSDDAVLGL